MSKPDLTQLPDTYTGEVMQKLATIVASAVPIIGPVGAEIIGLLIQPHVTKRRDEWLEYLGHAVAELLQREGGPTIEDLVKSETFTTAVLHTSQIAVRTHQLEKLALLRNAVLNVAVETEIDENLQLTFMHYIDILTPLYVDLLSCVSDPLAWAAKRVYPIHDTHNVDAGVMFGAVHSDSISTDYNKVLLQDLYVRRLAANKIDPFGPLYPHDVEDALPHITALGQQFLAFIISPIADSEEQEVNAKD